MESEKGYRGLVEVEGRKMWSYEGDDLTINRSDVFVQGDVCRVKGDRVVITGSHNFLEGEDFDVKGDSNIVIGRRGKVDGERNEVINGDSGVIVWGKARVSLVSRVEVEIKNKQDS
jgi:hypothetical protein